MIRVAYFRVALHRKAFTGGYLDNILSRPFPSELSWMIATYLVPYEQCYFSLPPSINVRKAAKRHEDITNILEFMVAALDDRNPEAASLFLPCMRLDMSGFENFEKMDSLLIRYGAVCSELKNRELYNRLNQSSRFFLTERLQNVTERIWIRLVLGI